MAPRLPVVTQNKKHPTNLICWVPASLTEEDSWVQNTSRWTTASFIPTSQSENKQEPNWLQLHRLQIHKVSCSKSNLFLLNFTWGQRSCCSEVTSEDTHFWNVWHLSNSAPFAAHNIYFNKRMFFKNHKRSPRPSVNSITSVTVQQSYH